jgi:hypothetical protein
VSIPATLPDVIVSGFEILNSVVATLKPPNVESCLVDRRGMLLFVEREFQPPW